MCCRIRVHAPVKSGLEAKLSYELTFWKTTRRIDPADVYAKISDGKRVRGLEKLDSSDVEDRLISAFLGWTIDASLATKVSRTAISTAESALDVSYTPQSVVCTCYGLSNEDLNRIIDIMHTLGLPLYDPQTRERFA